MLLLSLVANFDADLASMSSYGVYDSIAEHIMLFWV